MQTPGNKFVGRCTHCGNKDRVVVVVNVTWPDQKLTVERLCEEGGEWPDGQPQGPCLIEWAAQLERQGCVLDPSPGVKALV